MKSNRLLYLGLAGISGLLMFGGWPPRFLVPMLFAGFMPLLYLRHMLTKNGSGRFYSFYVYLALLIWNTFTTWWVGYASVGGAIAMVFANSAFMLIPFSLFQYTALRIGETRGLIGFVCYWLAFEYLHLNWQISFPWLTLGNGLAMFPEFVQWYKYTGVLGGSLWILVVNILLYRSVLAHSTRKYLIVASAFLIPAIVSFTAANQINHADNNVEVLIIQPNIDPYNKFDTGEEINQVKKFLQLAEGSITDSTHMLVLPETAIVEYLDEDYFDLHESIQLLTGFSQKHRNIKIFTGASTYSFFKPGEKRSETARKSANGEFYDSYNTALLIDSSGVLQVYHKSRLVPGVEKMPYPAIFGFLENLSIDMGGISGSLGSSDEPEVFKTGKLNITPAICYESVYGGYMGGFVRKGADILGVITNDGWWQNTDGYRQHLAYGKLRCVEFDMQMIRCANTGISCVVNEKGAALNKTSWWKAEVFLAKVHANKRLTFYAVSGDYIGKIAAFISVFLLLSLMVKKWAKK